jgi:hypothetical protein
VPRATKAQEYFVTTIGLGAWSHYYTSGYAHSGARGEYSLTLLLLSPDGLSTDTSMLTPHIPITVTDNHSQPSFTINEGGTTRDVVDQFLPIIQDMHGSQGIHKSSFQSPGISPLPQPLLP